MKLCVPSMLPGGPMAPLAPNFIVAPCYTLISISEGGKKSVEVIPNPSPGDLGLPAKLMAHGVTTVVCVKIQTEILVGMWKCNIRAFVGAFGTVDDAVNVYRSGTLAEAYVDDDYLDEEEEE